MSNVYIITEAFKGYFSIYFMQNNTFTFFTRN